MFEKFSEKSIKLVFKAQEEARLLNKNIVNTEHLLLGLIQINDEAVSLILNSNGITLQKLRNETKLVTKMGNGFVSTEIPFSDCVKNVFSLAEIYARGHKNIEPKHIFKAILHYKEKDNAALKILKNFDIKTDEIEENL